MAIMKKLGPYDVTDEEARSVANNKPSVTAITIPKGRMRGDIDGDGKITNADYDLLYAHTTRANIITDELQLWCADVAGGNGTVNGMDTSSLYAYINGSGGSLTSTPTLADYYGNWTYSKIDDKTGEFYVDFAMDNMTANSNSVIYISGEHASGNFRAECMDGMLRLYAKLCPIADTKAIVQYSDGDGAVLVVKEDVEIDDTNAGDGVDISSPNDIYIESTGGGVLVKSTGSSLQLQGVDTDITIEADNQLDMCGYKYGARLSGDNEQTGVSGEIDIAYEADGISITSTKGIDIKGNDTGVKIEGHDIEDETQRAIVDVGRDSTGDVLIDASWKVYITSDNFVDLESACDVNITGKDAVYIQSNVGDVEIDAPKGNIKMNSTVQFNNKTVINDKFSAVKIKDDNGDDCYMLVGASLADLTALVNLLTN